MTKKVPKEYIDLFTKKAFGHLATVMPDGAPQVSPLWVDYDGVDLLINSAKGRIKDKNMRRDSRVAVEVQDPDDPYRYILIRGTVVEITEEGGQEHIDKLAMRYIGKDHKVPGQVRVIYKIRPDKIFTSS